MSQSDSNAPSDVASGFLSHLIEMRDRLLRVAIVVSVAFFGLFPFSKNIYNWLAAPLVDQGQEMLIIGPVAPFLVPMKLTLLVSFLITLPYLFYQLWSFVAPGLYKHEKRLIYPLLASSIFLFYLGIAFVYYLLLPMMFQIIPTFAPDIAKYSPDISHYLDFTIMMFIAFGFGFEMPIATILLISTGMTTAESLSDKRPYVIVGAFIVGMFLTPPDIISQVMLAIPMWLLFELGLIFSKYFDIRIKEASNARDDIDSGKSTSDTQKTIAADDLWEDDKYTYKEDTSKDSSSNNDNPIFDGYKEDDSFDTSSTDSKTDSEKGFESTNNETVRDEDAFFNESDDFKELSTEDMEAELDRIEELEKAEKRIKKKAKKRAKKKAKAEKEKKAKKNKDEKD